MGKASILFTLPSDPGDLPAILERHCAVPDRNVDIVDEDGFREYLAGFEPGSVVGFDFEDTDDPLDPIIDLSKALEAMGARFWAHSDAFEERSRRLRVDGRILLRLGDGTETFELPWSEGDPAFDERTLRAAEVPEETVSAAIAWAFPSSIDNESEAPRP